MQVGQARHLGGFAHFPLLDEDKADALKTLKHKSAGWEARVGLLPLVGYRRSGLDQRLSEALLRESIDEQAEDHNEPGRHHALDRLSKHR